MSSSFVRFSMKYSSTSSVAVSGDVRGCDVMAASRRGRGQDARRAVPPDRASVLRGGDQLDTPDHSVPVDFVHVERLPDAPEQHDRQLAAEVLAELLEPAEDAAAGHPATRGVRDSSGADSSKPTATSRSRIRRQSAPAGSRSDRHNCCPARCRSPPLRRVASRWLVICSSLCAAQCPKSSGREDPSSNGSPPVATCARWSAAERRISRSIASPSRAASSAASLLEAVEERRVPDERDLDRLGNARPPVAVGERRRGTRRR